MPIAITLEQVVSILADKSLHDPQLADVIRTRAPEQPNWSPSEVVFEKSGVLIDLSAYSIPRRELPILSDVA